MVEYQEGINVAILTFKMGSQMPLFMLLYEHKLETQKASYLDTK